MSEEPAMQESCSSWAVARRRAGVEGGTPALPEIEKTLVSFWRERLTPGVVLSTLSLECRSLPSMHLPSCADIAEILAESATEFSGPKAGHVFFEVQKFAWQYVQVAVSTVCQTSNGRPQARAEFE